MTDITNVASWHDMYSGQQELSFDLLTVSAKYYPDNTARVTFYAEGQTECDERGISEVTGYDPILTSDWIRGETEEECKVLVRKYINEHMVEAVEKVLNRARAAKSDHE